MLRPFAAALTLAIALAATPLCASAQTSTREAKLGAFFRYGMDAQLIRLDTIQRVTRIDGRGYVRTVDPGDGHVGYLILTLTVKNVGSERAALPALVTTIATDTGPALAPPVLGPFLNASTAEPTPDTKVPPHSTSSLHLAVIDIPNGRRITSITFSPNDTTAQFHFRLGPHDVRALREVPR